MADSCGCPKQKSRAGADLRQLQLAMCSMDVSESCWSQVSELPQLPVPDLWLTVSRYLGSLKAILAPSERPSQARLHRAIEAPDELETQRRRAQFEETSRLVHKFMLHEGPQLQRDLKEYASKRQNWATEYWLQDMYLSNSLPLPVNSNPFFLFPRQEFGSSREMLMFATRLIQFSVDFKYRIDQMPHEDMDRLLPQSRRSNHIVVASCDQFYILRLGQDPLDNPYKRDSSSLNSSTIFEQLLRIYRVSRECARRSLNQSPACSLTGTKNCDADDDATQSMLLPKVGFFTTENRKVWAKIHKRLTHLDDPEACESNSQSLRLIEDCLFVLCLDSLVQASSDQDSPISAIRDEPTKEEHATRQLGAANVILTGAGSKLFTGNRWFDKFLQIIVGRDGTCGINIEHSASEGITVLRFIEEFLNFVKLNPPNEDSSLLAGSNNGNGKLTRTAGSGNRHGQLNEMSSANSSITSAGYVEPKSPSDLLSETDKITRLQWRLDESLLQCLAEARSNVDKLIDNFELKILTFGHFGRSFIKNQNLSPDAFIQLALQFTFFKEHGHLVSTYESASLRQFRFGRVDNIRANTCEAYDWIQSMLDYQQQDQASSNQLLKQQCESQFIRAITKQVEILRYTIIGSGPDNHLMALRQLARIRYDEDELPELFTDPSYRDFLNFRLSTSQLPNESGVTVGYGAVVPNGYGCSYNPRNEQIIFCVSSFRDCPLTSAHKFAQSLEESLLEMRALCLGRGT